MVSAIGQFISSLITVMVHLVQLLLLGTDTLVDIFSALFDEGKRLHTSTCPHHTYSANASTRILDSRARAVANTDAPYITA